MTDFTKRLFALLMILAVLLTASCHTSIPAELRVDNTPKTESDEVFSEFLDEFFKHRVNSDSISMNYFLRSPENFGITPIKPTFGSVGDYDADHADFMKFFNAFNAFDPDELTGENLLIYDILHNYFTVESEFADKELYYLMTAISPGNGIHIQLPILLSEYRFYSIDCVEHYLELLTDINRYFGDILAFEQKKSEMGLFMSNTTLDAVIDGCAGFLTFSDNNMLITTFNTRLEEFSQTLTGEQITTYRTTNKNHVINHVVPAYNLLADGLEQLRGTGKNDLGLAHFPKGRQYFGNRVRSKTGSSKSITELAAIIDSRMAEIQDEIYQMLMADFSILDLYLNDEYDFGYNFPNEIAEYQRTKTAELFPAPPNVDYLVKNIHTSLMDVMGPAFYLTPPIDDYSQNLIYINPARLEGSRLFTVMAHEGFPGHLYQTTYFYSLNVHPVRKIMNFPGYTEGWATYVEHKSYYWGNPETMPVALASLLRLDNEFSLALQTRIDIGVNYEGWSVSDVFDFLQDFGFGDMEHAADLLNYVAQNPAITMQYYVGLLEIYELLDFVKGELGDNFDLLRFHRAILHAGPMPFELLKRQLEQLV
jgi:uncharacterized protein (DUF885 family)